MIISSDSQLGLRFLENPVKVFSYGTLQKSSVQIELFGRKLQGTVDTLSNYEVLNDLKVDGKKYPRLVFKKNGIVFGKVYELTHDEIKKLDEYETTIYTRTDLITDSRITVNVYLET